MYIILYIPHIYYIGYIRLDGITNSIHENLKLSGNNQRFVFGLRLNVGK